MEQRVSNLLEKVGEADKRIARLQGELASTLANIKELAGTEDLDEAKDFWTELEEEVQQEKEELENEIANLEDLYDRAESGEDVSAEIARYQDESGDRSRAGSKKMQRGR